MGGLRGGSNPESLGLSRNNLPQAISEKQCNRGKYLVYKREVACVPGITDSPAGFSDPCCCCEVNELIVSVLIVGLSYIEIGMSYATLYA